MSKILRDQILCDWVRAPERSEIDEALVRGKQDLYESLVKATPLCLHAREMFTAAGLRSDHFYRLQSGWACQYQELGEGRRAIIDLYLPGDFIGFNAPFNMRPIENVLALTAVEVVGAGNVFDARASRDTILFIAWLLGHRQHRTDRLLAAISSYDARGRLAVMILDLYKRLRRRKLISTESFNMPLTHRHIGAYLGLTVVHVNRVLKFLRDERIARLERHFLTILDMERLVLLSRNRKMLGRNRMILDCTRTRLDHCAVECIQ
jgi:CRP-like cAMP-binding protein